jgi:hypothetical protein
MVMEWLSCCKMHIACNIYKSDSLLASLSTISLLCTNSLGVFLCSDVMQGIGDGQSLLCSPKHNLRDTVVINERYVLVGTFRTIVQ